MYCPSCGSEERQLSQFCRGCGTDLRAVRTGLERSDTIASPADTARAEIGRAIATRITELKTGRDLQRVAAWVLPKVEKFLETPEEKRLRLLRAGVITSSVGLGAILMFVMVALATGKEELLVPACAAVVAFFIGLGILINGKFLSVEKKKRADHVTENGVMDAFDRLESVTSSERRVLPGFSGPPLSVAEHTTHRLQNEPVKAPRRPTIANDDN